MPAKMMCNCETDNFPLNLHLALRGKFLKTIINWAFLHFNLNVNILVAWNNLVIVSKPMTYGVKISA